MLIEHPDSQGGVEVAGCEQDDRDQRLVVRRSTRPAESLAWELDLLEYLLENGIGVPKAVVADDGRRHVDGVMVCQFVEGREPSHGLDGLATRG
ncbi:hypothetical protein JNW90_32355 [Micromonospora sp. STR1s_5]|nr:hypothetical protein [Micromonospora sp. STR1s_5]